MEQLLHIPKSFIKKGTEKIQPQISTKVENAFLRQESEKWQKKIHLRKIKNVFTDTKMLQKNFDCSQNLGIHNKYKKKKQKEKKKRES